MWSCMYYMYRSTHEQEMIECAVYSAYQPQFATDDVYETVPTTTT